MENDTSALFKYLCKRSMLPLHPPISLTQPSPADAKCPKILKSADGLEIPDRRNVQGDVFMLFPKQAESFSFFVISDQARFKTDLKSYKPTTSEDVVETLYKIEEAKRKAAEMGESVKHVDTVQTQIAFSRAGLKVLGVEGETKDSRFDKGPMSLDKESLGDANDWDPVFADGIIHGVIVVATSDLEDSMKRLEDKTKNILENFQSSISVQDEEIMYFGNNFPNRSENFGYRDGISQPALRGLIMPHQGQMEVDPGVIIMGYKGDPVFDNQSITDDSKRPAWTKDGSIMVFRKLEQDVLDFKADLKVNCPYIDRKFLESAAAVRSIIPFGPELTDQTSTDQRGLFLVCYQSSLDHGFYLQSTSFGDDDYFPKTSLTPQKHDQDPVIGVPEQTTVVAGGPDDVNSDSQVNLVVTSKGGEYFFVPSVSTLKSWANNGNLPALDLLFLQDLTGSQMQYIQAAKDGFQDICKTISDAGHWSKEDFRVGLITFRDYPEADPESSFITKSYEFTSDITAMEDIFRKLEAKGGGEGPEAQTVALDEALSPDWREDAIKIAVLITDSPPHGIGEYGDLIAGGDPDQKDPLKLVRKMAESGINLYVIAYEPMLSTDYDNALDFYNGLVRNCSGQLISIVNANTLPQVISGKSIETILLEKIISLYQKDIAEQVLKKDVPVGDVAKTLYSKLQKDDLRVDTCVIESIYEDSIQGEINAKIWHDAENIADGRNSIIKITGRRVKKDFQPGTERTQKIVLKSQPITFEQVNRVVLQSVMRNSIVGPGSTFSVY